MQTGETVELTGEFAGDGALALWSWEAELHACSEIWNRTSPTKLVAGDSTMAGDGFFVAHPYPP